MVTFDGTSGAQTISGTSTTSFYDVHVTNSSGLNLNSTTNARWDHEITFGSGGYIYVPDTDGSPYWQNY